MQSKGSQLWDTVFITQAIIASDIVDEFGTTLKKAHQFIKKSQVSLPLLKALTKVSFLTDSSIINLM